MSTMKMIHLLGALTFSTAVTIADEPHFFVRGDVFYWNIREDGLDFAIKNGRPTDEHKGSGYEADRHGKVKNGNFGWDVGGRAGFGYRFNHDNWVLSALWTHLNGSETNHEHVNPEKKNLFITRVHPGGVGSEHAVIKSATSAMADLNLHYNVADLELSRTAKITDYIEIKPLFGLRAAWIHQNFDIHYHHVSTKDLFLNFSHGRKTFPEETVFLKNDFFGIGGRFGFDSNWFFTRQFSIFANANASLLWGFFKIDMKEKRHLNNDKIEDIVDLNDSYHDTIANLELALGIRWQMGFSEDRFRLSVSLGWEQLLWFSLNQLDKFPDHNNPGIIFKEHGNLNLSGITLSTCFEF